MTTPEDFSNERFADYLRSLCDSNAPWWKTYAFIDEIDDATWFEFELNSKTQDKPKQPGEKPSEKTLLVLQAVEDYAHEKILIVGSPGAGKSTLLTRLLWQAAQKAQQNAKAPIPVLVELKLYGEGGIWELIQTSLENCNVYLEIPDIKKLVEHRRLLLLADGFNELPSDRARAEFKRFCSRKIPVIVTSRDGTTDLELERKLQIQPLTNAKVKAFLQSRLSGYAQSQIKELGDRVKDFGQTPLMVWMLFSIFRQNGDIPTTRGEAYRTFTTLYTERAKEGIDLDESRGLLSKFAFELMHAEKPTDFRLDISEVDAQNLVGSEKALKHLVRNHLLQAKCDPRNRRISFCHQSLQEYYAAEALLVMLQDKHPDVMDDKRLQYFYLNYLKWTEVVSIALSLMEDETQALQLVHLALEVDRMLGAKLVNQLNERCQHSVIQLIAAQLICNSLKVRLLGETRAKSAATELVALFEEVDFSDSSGRSDVLDALEQIGRVGVSLAICKAFDDPTLVGKAFLFLGKLESDESFQLLAGAVEHSDPGIRWGSAMALAEMNSEASIQVLFKAIKNSNFDVQISAAFALGTLGFEIAIPILKQAIDLTDSLDICKMAIFALAKIDSEQAVLIFRQLMQHPDFSDLAINVLMTMDLEAIAPRLHEIIYGVRHKFENKIAVILSSKDITDSLLERAVQDARPDVVESLATLLRKTGNFYPQMIDVLWKHQIKLYQKEVAETISAIQAKYQFYNYEIAKWELAPHTIERSLTNIIQGDYIAGDKIEGDKNIIDRVGIINTGDVTIQGNQNGETLNL